MIKPGTIIFSLFLVAVLLLQCTPSQKDTKQMIVYAGTYTEADSQGIELYRLNQQDGSLSYLKTVSQVKNPSYLQFSPDQKYLYAVNELLQWHDRPGGAVSAFRVNQKNGDLSFINQVSSLGRAPCYLTTSNNGRFVLLNNYLGGTALSLPVQENGGLGQPVSLLHFSGSGLLKERQDASHVHSINLNPQNNLALVADLGTDKLSLCSFEPHTGKLTLREGETVQTGAGAGPRHLTFSADGSIIFLANELNNTAETFRLKNGSMKHLQTISTVPPDFNGKNYPADIHLSPDGRFLYVSNRGHESIAVFKVNQTNGLLSFISVVPVEGSWPRNFILSRNGDLLLVANQKSKNIVVFRRDTQNGLLTFLSKTSTLAAPACLKIAAFD